MYHNEVVTSEKLMVTDYRGVGYTVKSYCSCQRNKCQIMRSNIMLLTGVSGESSDSSVRSVDVATESRTPALQLSTHYIRCIWSPVLYEVQDQQPYILPLFWFTAK